MRLGHVLYGLMKSNIKQSLIVESFSIFFFLYDFIVSIYVYMVHILNGKIAFVLILMALVYLESFYLFLFKLLGDINLEYNIIL